MIWGHLKRPLLLQGAGSLNPRHIATRSFPSSTKSSPTKASTSDSRSKPRANTTRRLPNKLRNPVLVFQNRRRSTSLNSGSPPIMSNFVHIVATPSADITGGSLMLHFDHRRYHFGSLSQGLQRSYVERGLALSKLERLFISGTVSWDNIGGLLGMMLTVADSLAAAKQEQDAVNAKRKVDGKPLLPLVDRKLEVFGAENLNYAVASARNFVFRQGMPINTWEFDEDPRKPGVVVDWSRPDWEDDCVRVWQVPVTPELPNGDVKSPRKRSFDVMTESVDMDTTPDSLKSQRQATKEICQSVVDAMFNSDWSRDRLVESRLGDIKQPAKMWVRRDGQLEAYTGPLPSKDPDQDPGIAETMVFVREPWPSVKTTMLPAAERSITSISYIVKNRGRRGKFNPKVAKELGVKPTDFKKLTAGETVEGKDGITVTPEMVLGESLEGTGFAFVDIPSTEYIESFLERPEWTATELLSGIHAFYWNLGRGVFDDERIQEFIRSRPNQKHILMGPDISPNMLTYAKFAGLFTRLGCIDPDRFPVLDFDNNYKDVSSAGSSAVAGRAGMKVKLLPNYEFDDSETIPFPTLDEIDSLDPDVLKLAREAREKIAQPQFQAAVDADEQDIPNRDAEVISLGTGSALPSKYRNVSATLIRVPGVGNYLLDCGENTIGQLRRAFSKEEFESVMQDMRAIFISHMHADHHLGIASVLSHWHKLTTGSGDSDKKLTICGPPEMRRWLNEFSGIEDIGRSRILYIEAKDADILLNKKQLVGSGLSSLEAVPVKHCHNAFAGILTWPSGLKIAYSGDCRPSRKFAALARDATLLIHESTFDDDKKGDAEAKRHCTMGEALSVAEDMRARRVLLTHFSQRYAKIPLLGERIVAVPEEEADGKKGRDQVVLFAFDQMRVKIGEFKHAAEFLPALRKLFDVEDGAGDS